MREAYAPSATNGTRRRVCASRRGWALRDRRREEHDVREGDGHATACGRVAHVPCVAEEDDALLGMRSTLLDRWEEGVGHAPETVFR
jgi:hypothetical protein